MRKAAYLLMFFLYSCDKSLMLEYQSEISEGVCFHYIDASSKFIATCNGNKQESILVDSVIEGIDYSDEFIAVKQRDKYSSISQYWIIRKSNLEVYGPLTREGYLHERLAVKAPADLDPKNIVKQK